jgi:hypothetical protein
MSVNRLEGKKKEEKKSEVTTTETHSHPLLLSPHPLLLSPRRYIFGYVIIIIF